MRNLAFIFLVLLLGLCSCQKKEPKPETPAGRTSSPAKRTRTAVAKKTPGAQEKPGNISADSMGAVTDLVFRSDYSILAQRPCFSARVVTERLKKEPKNADLHFALALGLPFTSLDREESLEKAAELQPNAPYPLLELMCLYNSRGDFKRAKEAALELTDFLADKSVSSRVMKRCANWLRGFMFYDDTQCNDTSIGVMEVLAPYSQEVARAVARYYVVYGNDAKALSLCRELMKPETEGEKRAWLEILECVDSPQAQELINELGLPESEGLSRARSRHIALQRELARGNTEWFGDELQSVRRQILKESTNETERLEIAAEYLRTGLMSDDRSHLEEYVETLQPVDTPAKRRELSVLLSTMSSYDMDDEAALYGTRLYVSSSPKDQPLVLAELLKSELQLDDDLIEEAAKLYPDNIELIKSIGAYYAVRKNYEKAADWHKKLLALLKTDVERNAVLRILAEDLAAAGRKDELVELYSQAEENASGLSGDLKVTLLKIQMGLSGTNVVWQDAAEALAGESDPHAKALLLDFLLKPSWNKVKGAKETAPAIVSAVLQEDIAPETLKNLPVLFEKLGEVEAKPEMRRTMRFMLVNGVNPPQFYELLSLFDSKEEAEAEVRNWIEEAKLGPLELMNFYVSTVAYRLGFDEANLSLLERVWEMTSDLYFRQRSSLFYTFYSFANSEKIPKEKKNRFARILFESWMTDFRRMAEGGFSTPFFDDPGEIIEQATEAEKREMAEIISENLKKDRANFALVNLYKKLIKELGMEKEGLALLEEHFSPENLVRNPNNIWIYENLCSEMGKEFDVKEVLRSIVEAQTNLSNFSQTYLIYMMRENGLGKEADELCGKLLDEPNVPWFVKQGALYNIKNTEKRLEKTFELVEQMPPGEGKNELYFQILNNCNCEKWKDKFKEALEYLQSSRKDYVWDRIFNEARNAPYEVDMEQLFNNYEQFLSEKKDKEEVERLVSASRMDYYESKGDWKKALEEGEKLIGKDPGQGANLAQLYLKAGDPKKAEETYRDLLRAYEDACQEGDASHREWLTSAIDGLKELTMKGEAELDEQTLRRAFLSGEEPKIEDYRNFLSYGEGILPFSVVNESYEQVLKLAKDDDEKNYLIRDWMESARNYDDTNTYRKVLAMGAESNLDLVPEYLTLLSSEGKDKEAFQKGWEAWEKSENAGRWQKRSLENQLFEICVKAGEKEKAWEVLSEKWKPDQKDSYLYLDAMGIVNLAEKLGRGKEALENLSKYIETTGNAYSKLNNAMGIFNAYKKLEDPEGGKAFLDKFLENMPKTGGNPAQRLDLVFNSSHPEKGLDMIREIAENPGDRNFNYYLSRANNYFDQNNDKEGKINFLRSLPESFETREQLASAYRSSGDSADRDKAVALLKENLRDDEVEYYRKQSSRRQLLDLALEGGKDQYLLNELVNDYNSDQTLNKSERNRYLAELYTRSEDYVKADNLYQEWLQGTKNPLEKDDVRREYADMLEKSGREKEAIEQYKEIMERQKNDPDSLNSTRDKLIRLYTNQGDALKAENIRRERISEYEKILSTVPYGPQAKELKQKIEAERKAIEEAKTPKG